MPALDALAVSRKRTKMVLLSYSYLGDRIWTLPEKARSFAFIAYPLQAAEG